MAEIGIVSKEKLENIANSFRIALEITDELSLDDFARLAGTANNSPMRDLLREAIEVKGVTVPESTSLEDLYDYILQIGLPEGAFLILADPSDAYGDVGETVTFKIVAVGAVTYQWQYSTDGSRWYNSGMAGSTTSAVNVPVTTLRVGQQYRCIVTNAEGETLTSSVAIILSTN